VLKPTAEERALLGPIGGFAYWFADLFAGPLKWLSVVWNATFGVTIVWLATWRRLSVAGVEHLASIQKGDSVILVANHRSLFDFYVIAPVSFSRSHISRRIFFPVRSKFFYENIAGIALNFVVAGMTMFPPIMRDPKRKAFNKYAVARMGAELAIPGTTLGIHPEGTRNKNPDPHTYLRAQPGLGRLVLAAPNAKVVPVFVRGVGNTLFFEFIRNTFMPRRHPIFIGFGPPVDLTAFSGQTPRLTLEKAIADHCMAAVAAIGDEDRKRYVESSPAVQEPT